MPIYIHPYAYQLDEYAPAMSVCWVQKIHTLTCVPPPTHTYNTETHRHTHTYISDTTYHTHTRNRCVYIAGGSCSSLTG
jgi:hypothetical protein